MGIEQRKGNLYYYSKRRKGDRVVSEYVGSGEVAYIADHLAKQEKQQRQAERELATTVQAGTAEIDSALDSHSRAVDALVGSYLQLLGYHKHNRQWRRRRGNGKG
jgi:hypothetical protein